jgi:hypothetical protein
VSGDLAAAGQAGQAWMNAPFTGGSPSFGVIAGAAAVIHNILARRGR